MHGVRVKRGLGPDLSRPSPPAVPLLRASWLPRGTAPRQGFRDRVPKSWTRGADTNQSLVKHLPRLPRNTPDWIVLHSRFSLRVSSWP